ncbi:hypothetical protein N7463_008995 [Penicillium fimorum]|uniref:Uncharacterized protein n=1 Tax=Penicillium fimorum TaxID=1882269 RepID=A0A9W9XQ07_9EURO|nr:hypothetical protein N7463_008995 [Penicillium fimorum]
MPQSLTYFEIVFGILVGAVSIGDAVRKREGDAEGGELNIELHELELGEGVDEWGLSVRGDLAV